MNKILQTVVETPEFTRQAAHYIDDISKQRFINFIAQNPLTGELIPGTGGARKVRWARNNYQGKRGGVRIIYYYYNQTLPIFLFSVYSKNKKANLSAKEKNTLYSVVKEIVITYRDEINE